MTKRGIIMVAIGLIAVFLLVGWLTLIIPLSNSDTIQIILCVAMGLVAVNITGISMIINRIDSLHTENDKKEEQNKTDDNKSDTAE